MIKILLVDDHALFIRGLQMLLSMEPEKYEVFGIATNGKEALDILKSNEIDVVLMDINMPVMNGFEAIFKIKQLFPKVKVVSLTMHADDDCVMRILEAGAYGYLFKNVDENELYECIEMVHQGAHYVTQSRSHVLNNYEKKLKDVAKGYDKIYHQPLSNREIEIVKFIMQGKTNQDIADILFLSHRTVDTHRKNILTKLELNNTASLVKYATEHAPFLGLS